MSVPSIVLTAIGDEAEMVVQQLMADDWSSAWYRKGGCDARAGDNGAGLHVLLISRQNPQALDRLVSWLSMSMSPDSFRLVLPIMVELDAAVEVDFAGQGCGVVHHAEGGGWSCDMAMLLIRDLSALILKVGFVAVDYQDVRAILNTQSSERIEVAVATATGEMAAIGALHAAMAAVGSKKINRAMAIVVDGLDFEKFVAIGNCWFSWLDGMDGGCDAYNLIGDVILPKSLVLARVAVMVVSEYGHCHSNA